MKKTTLGLCAAVAFALLGTLSGPTRAPAAQTQVPAKQPAIPKSFDLNKLTCRDLTAADLLDRSNAIMFLWGFEAGRRNVTSWSTVDLEKATERLMDTCEAKPTLSLFAALDAVKKTNAK